MVSEKLNDPDGQIEARVLEGPPVNDDDDRQLFLKVYTGGGTLVWQIDEDEAKRLRNTIEHPQPLGRTEKTFL